MAVLCLAFKSFVIFAQPDGGDHEMDSEARSLPSSAGEAETATIQDPYLIRSLLELQRIWVSECGMFAGSVASQTVLGGPDIILITLSEFAEQIHRVNRALIFDAYNGRCRSWLW